MDVVGATKRINGGTIGLDDRKKHYLHAIDVLGGDYEEPKTDYNQTIRKRSQRTFCSRSTRKIRHKSSRWHLGPWHRENWLQNWQSSNGLVADGIVGPKTLGKLLG